ncbi:uncharacterized protein PHACADRAFT_204417 [Phanerochaete carnosa HHB-10118-sp]|uniref:dCMP deaminase n=1 Tax=Phanerochaete carnosa (strain HHB-10118-sp) TaxID=650164 RepID=K5VE32_PHACS|nr:uncharacterized protein PHACADRAFT_204417 [Phanerochaete carnosa HHB-10118-sp]EKM61256.1 hypothetical protein PHACADRAFT_204417 [Phanerochaete carnosa HHB-10118-sp]
MASSFPAISDVPPSESSTIEDHLTFSSHTEMLDYVTKNWRSDFVTVDLRSQSLLEKFSTRPFFMVKYEASIYSLHAAHVHQTECLVPSFLRGRSGENSESLRTFVQEHDEHFYGPSDSTSQYSQPATRPPLRTLHHLVSLYVINSFDNLEEFHRHLESLDLANPERLRPGWDTYFMRLASLASLRSNCMKRRVGAILVRNKRILASGYNGTPRGLTNCNEGGCTRCNMASETVAECVCLHAEENALLEAGRERVGDGGAVLYCNT